MMTSAIRRIQTGTPADLLVTAVLESRAGQVTAEESVSYSELLWRHLMWASLALLELQPSTRNRNTYLLFPGERSESTVLQSYTPPLQRRAHLLFQQCRRL